MKKRDGLEEALTKLALGDAEVLIVAKLDRLSRSVADFATILEMALDEEWSVVAVDMGIDTTTPSGELMVNILMAMAQWERRMIALRTKEALAEKRRQGIVLGRPPGIITDHTRRAVWKLHDEGLSLRKIVAELTDREIDPPGKTWNAAAVKRIVDSRETEGSEGDA